MFKVLCFYFFLFCCFTLCKSGCVDYKTCRECIGFTSDTCVWCSSEENKSERCQSRTYHNENLTWCKGQVYDPQSDITFVKNYNLNEGKNGAEVIQLQPQHLLFKARPGVPVNFIISYKPAIDYPLDVYYLLDSSKTMDAYKRKLKNEANYIYKALTNLTNNVYLGVGSFVEKPAMPFAMGPHHSTYTTNAFTSNLKLTNDMKSFEEAVDRIAVGANYDNPEAGFDALVQSMVCKEEVGWRPVSRRIIVLSTDDTYHSAGDGKYVGAYKPNDMICHLKNGVYNEQLKFDYPSISQINKIAKETNVIIIFAIFKDSIFQHYRFLNEKIYGAKVLTIHEATNIVKFISAEYMKSVRAVEIRSELPLNMALTLEPDCTKRDVCTILHNKILHINATLIINKCPRNENSNDKNEISIVGIGETLKIDLDCDCDCEKSGQEYSSPKCSKHGTYQCGICECDKDSSVTWMGDTCQCQNLKYDSTSTSVKNMDKCTLPSKNITLPCSGHGICWCGECNECWRGFSGEFCQFNDDACPKSNGRICAGNGDCKFEKCQCQKGWSEPDCRCPDHERDCIYNEQVCSNNGNCICGECVCTHKNNTEAQCTGKFCEDCDDEASNRCNILENYALCNIKENKKYCDEKYNKTDIEVEVVNRTDIDAAKSSITIKWCRKILKNDETLTFGYYYLPTTKTKHLIIQNELDLPPKAAIWVVCGSAIGTILLIGLLTLLGWKFLVDMYDQREYEKFIAESNTLDCIVANPTYESPISTVTNPTYNQSSAQKSILKS